MKRACVGGHPRAPCSRIEGNDTRLRRAPTGDVAANGRSSGANCYVSAGYSQARTGQANALRASGLGRLLKCVLAGCICPQCACSCRRPRNDPRGIDDQGPRVIPRRRATGAARRVIARPDARRCAPREAGMTILRKLHLSHPRFVEHLDISIPKRALI